MAVLVIRLLTMNLDRSIRMKLLFGCGYLGSRVAQLWRAAGDSVTVVTRSGERAKQFAAEGYEALVADVAQPHTLADLPVADTVLFAVGFDRGFDRSQSQSIHDVYAGGVRNVLDALPAGTGRLIYISTTGVYGPSGGDWVDEQTPPNPQRDGGIASLVAEESVRKHPLGEQSVILRLAGIYGPGRIPFLAKLRAAEPIAAPQNGHINLIHVDDAAQCVLAAERLPQDSSPSQTFCLCDGKPVQRKLFYREVARLIDAQPPRFVAPDPDSPRAVRAASDKRISNARMLSVLRARLSYPSHLEGLASILSGGKRKTQ